MLTTRRSEESIFEEALNLPPQARAAFLKAVCAGDAALHVRIEKLLKSHTGAGSFLQRLVPLTADEPLVERPGTIIGAFIISTLTNGLRILSVQQEWQLVVTGTIVILAVFLDILRRRR